MSDSSLKTTVVGGVIAGFSTLAATLAPYYLSNKPETEPTRPQREHHSRYEPREGNGNDKSPGRPGASPYSGQQGQRLAARPQADETPDQPRRRDDYAADVKTVNGKAAGGKAVGGKAAGVKAGKAQPAGEQPPAVETAEQDERPTRSMPAGKSGRFQFSSRNSRPVRPADERTSDERTSDERTVEKLAVEERPVEEAKPVANATPEATDPQGADLPAPAVPQTAESPEPKRRKR